MGWGRRGGRRCSGCGACCSHLHPYWGPPQFFPQRRMAPRACTTRGWPAPVASWSVLPAPVANGGTSCLHPMAHFLHPTARCLHPTVCSHPVARFLHPTVRFLHPMAHCLHPTVCSQPTACCLHPMAHFLHPMVCPHPMACCLHPMAHCLHPTARFLHPMVCLHPTASTEPPHPFPIPAHSIFVSLCPPPPTPPALLSTPGCVGWGHLELWDPTLCQQPPAFSALPLASPFLPS